MTYLNVLNDLNRGVLSPVYLFFGAERLLLEKTLEAVTNHLTPEKDGDFNYERIDGSRASIGQVIMAASLLPVFAEKRLVVVTNAPWFSSSKKEVKGEVDGEEDKKTDLLPLLQYLAQASSTTCLLFVAGDKIDNRRKIVKEIKKTGQVIEFASLRGGELNNWIVKSFQDKGKKISSKAMDYLTLAVGNDLLSLEQEIEKAALFVGDTPEVHLEDVEKTVSRTSNLTVFQLTDAVSKKDAAIAILLLRELVLKGEPELRILALLSTQIRGLLKILTLKKRGFTERQIVTETNLHPYVVKKGLGQCDNFSSQELVRALELLLEANMKPKIGKGEILPLMETAILKMC